MFKKIYVFLILLIACLTTQTTLHAQAIKEITSKQFYTLQRWNITDIATTSLKFQIYMISLTVLFFLFLITTIFYFKKKAKTLMWPTIFISLTMIILSILSIIDYSMLTPKSEKIAKNIVLEINKKTYLERRFLLKKFTENDYGFKLENINTNSKLLQKNHKYTLSFQVNYNFPFNLFGEIKKFYKYDFVYTPQEGKELQIKYSNIKIPNIKFIETTNKNVSIYNTYCFDFEELNKYNSGNDLEIIGKNQNNFSHYELEYVDLYSTKTSKAYCGKIRYNEKPYIGVDNNKTITLMEVK